MVYFALHFNTPTSTKYKSINNTHKKKQKTMLSDIKRNQCLLINFKCFSELISFDRISAGMSAVCRYSIFKLLDIASLIK